MNPCYICLTLLLRDFNAFPDLETCCKVQRVEGITPSLQNRYSTLLDSNRF
ncbi:Uncharacterised protein [Vibrio cholerae]|nr:Uncharacterised protein [Vibrio cholerae]